MKKSTIAVIVTLMIVAGFFLALSFMGPDQREYEKMKTPRISEMKDQNMLEVRLTGSPSQISGKGIGKLFSTFFALRKNHKDLKFSPPRARWPKDLTVKQEEWTGVFGLPLPDGITEKDLPIGSPADTNSTMKAAVTIWQYGTVAEILHVGSYDTETPDIDRLKKFIRENGYTIIGDHEEEYVRGPGPFSFNPKSYYTVIRYRVKK